MQEAGFEQALRLLPNVGAGAFARAEAKLREDMRAAQTTGTNQRDFTPTTASAPCVVSQKIGRNEKVKLIKEDKEIEVKSKKLEEYLNDGWKLK